MREFREIFLNSCLDITIDGKKLKINFYRIYHIIIGYYKNNFINYKYNNS